MDKLASMTKKSFLKGSLVIHTPKFDIANHLKPTDKMICQSGILISGTLEEELMKKRGSVAKALGNHPTAVLFLPTMFDSESFATESHALDELAYYEMLDDANDTLVRAPSGLFLLGSDALKHVLRTGLGDSSFI